MHPTAEAVESLLLSFLGDNPKSSRAICSLMTRKLAKEPGSVVFLSVRAWGHYDQDDFDAAIRDASQVIKRTPDSDLAWFVRGASYWHTGRTDKAEPDLTEAIERAAGVKVFLGDALRFRGGLRCNAGRSAEAIADLTRAIKVNKNDVWAHVFRGNAYVLAGEYAKAKKDYERAIKLDDEDGYSKATYGSFLATCPDDKMRDGRKALALVQAARETGDDDFLEDYAAALAECGQYDEAVKVQQRYARSCRDKAEKQKQQDRLEVYRSGKPYRVRPAGQ